MHSSFVLIHFMRKFDPVEGAMKLNWAGKASCMVPHAWAFSAARAAEGESTFCGIIEFLLVDPTPLYHASPGQFGSWAVVR
ncbi:MAG: hypothetical protein D6743_10245 [Calditrichaeota bacterium]|nr:MAG: hypothetical protein D6743_10245 [Calditrichota bacterium]